MTITTTSTGLVPAAVHATITRLAARMDLAWRDVTAHARRLDLPLRSAATALAVERVAQAHLQRGLYP